MVILVLGLLCMWLFAYVFFRIAIGHTNPSARVTAGVASMILVIASTVTYFSFDPADWTNY